MCECTLCKLRTGRGGVVLSLLAERCVKVNYYFKNPPHPCERCKGEAQGSNEEICCQSSVWKVSSAESLCDMQKKTTLRINLEILISVRVQEPSSISSAWGPQSCPSESWDSLAWRSDGSGRSYQCVWQPDEAAGRRDIQDLLPRAYWQDRNQQAQINIKI